MTIPSRLRKKLGADHIAWILATPHPLGTARSRARGAWDANEAESVGAYDALANLIEHDGKPVPPKPSWSAQWEAYFLGLSDLRGRGWGESEFEWKRKTGQAGGSQARAKGPFGYVWLATAGGNLDVYLVRSMKEARQVHGDLRYVMHMAGGRSALGGVRLDKAADIDREVQITREHLRFPVKRVEVHDRWTGLQPVAGLRDEVKIAALSGGRGSQARVAAYEVVYQSFGGRRFTEIVNSQHRTLSAARAAAKKLAVDLRTSGYDDLARSVQARATSSART